MKGFPSTKFILSAYAWADPGESIMVGQTVSNDMSAVTESGSLGLLAIGCAGLDAWRARRTEPD